METRFLQRGMVVVASVLDDLCVVIGSETEVTGGIVSDCDGLMHGMYMEYEWHTYDADGTFLVRSKHV